MIGGVESSGQILSNGFTVFGGIAYDGFKGFHFFTYLSRLVLAVLVFKVTPHRVGFVFGHPGQTFLPEPFIAAAAEKRVGESCIVCTERQTSASVKVVDYALCCEPEPPEITLPNTLIKRHPVKTPAPVGEMFTAGFDELLVKDAPGTSAFLRHCGPPR